MRNALSGTGPGNRPVPLRRRAAPLPSDLAALPAPRSDRDIGDRAFLPPALEIVEAPPSRGRVVLGYVVCGLLAAAIAGACLLQLRVYAVAPGIITATGATKVVEPRVRGQVSAVRVETGDRVQKGQVLVELDPTIAVATHTALAQQLTSLSAEMVRWRAELEAARRDPVATRPAVHWDNTIPQEVRQREERILHADLAQLAAALSDLAAERKQKEAARDKYRQSVAAQHALIKVIAAHVAMHQTLEQKGVESKAVLLDAESKLETAKVALTALQGSLGDAVAAIRVIDAAIKQTREQFLASDTQQLTTAEQQADELAQELQKADLTVRHMTLRAPIAGVVEASAVTTIGQLVKPGQQLMQVVPEPSRLAIDSYVLNTDAGFVRRGQPATIKVDTFPYTRYGTIGGTVVSVGRDAISGKQALLQQKNGSQPVARGVLSDTTAAQATNDLVFPVTIAPAETAMKIDGRETALAPGMTVVVQIETSKQSAIDYVLFPLLRGVPTLLGR